jgi:hypothetical protein
MGKTDTFPETVADLLEQVSRKASQTLAMGMGQGNGLEEAAKQVEKAIVDLSGVDDSLPLTGEEAKAKAVDGDESKAEEEVRKYEKALAEPIVDPRGRQQELK